MRVQFRNRGQADRYYKIFRKVLKEQSTGSDGARLGRDLIRNAIYRSFGYCHYPDFQRNFVPDEKVRSWFHSEEQLGGIFSRAIRGAMEIAHQRGIEFTCGPDELVKMVVAQVLDANEGALQSLIKSLASGQKEGGVCPEESIARESF